MAAMSPCRGTATAWTCIMAVTILPVRTGLSAPCPAIVAKDMASDYERADPAQNYAERRGITFRERLARLCGGVPEQGATSMAAPV